MCAHPLPHYRMPLKSRTSKSKVKNVQPKSFAGVAYKSTLEAYTAEQLTKHQLPVNYETWKVVLLPKVETQLVSYEPKTKKQAGYPSKVRTFSPTTQKLQQRIYTPDFVDTEKGWVIEVKGLKTEAFSLRYALFKNWLHQNELHHFRLYLPGNKAEVDAAIAHILLTNK